MRQFVNATRFTTTLFLLGLSLGVMLPRHSQAGSSCPLSNPAFADLRAAAIALENLVDLPASCQAKQSQLVAASQAIASNASALSHLLATPPSEERPLTDVERGQLDAVSSGILRISSVAGGDGASGDPKCAKALLSTGDFLLAFLDTVTAVSPLLVSAGGSSGLSGVLGVNLLSAAIRTFVTYFDGMKVNMSTAGARRAFTESACLFHDFDDSLRSLLQAIDGNRPDLEERIRKLERELAEWEQAAPPLPLPAPRIRELAAFHSREKLFEESFTELFRRLSESSGTTPCGLVRAQVEASLRDGGFPLNVASAVEELLEDPLRVGGTPPPVVRALIRHLHSLENPRLFSTANPQCGPRSIEWISAAREVVRALDGELALPGRLDLSDTPEGAKRIAWMKKHESLSATLLGERARLAALESLAGAGSQIDISELLGTHDHIRTALFGGKKDRKFLGIFPRKGPAESWLAQKDQATAGQLFDFEKQLVFARLIGVRDVGHPEAPLHLEHLSCAVGMDLVRTWETAGRHLSAARLFCDVFKRTITPSMHERVARHCVGRFDRKNRKIREAKIVERASQLEAQSPRIREIRKWMTDAGCTRAGGGSGSVAVDLELPAGESPDVL